MQRCTNIDASRTAVDLLGSELRLDRTLTWLPPNPPHEWDERITPAEIATAQSRFSRFEPVLAALFPDGKWDGRICSPLLAADPDLAPGWPNLFLKLDSELPMTGSVKARGGVYELLCFIEEYAIAQGLLQTGAEPMRLLEPRCRASLATARVIVASTGNLGFSIGLVARAFGCQAEIHMSHDAKTWKKDRLRRLGAEVIEHHCDYTETVARARASAEASRAYFVDDEDSYRLFLGYATAADELARQLEAQGVSIGPERPLVVYLPCGVGGAPGGITAGLRTRFGRHVVPVFVEPTRAPCVLLALASGEGAVSVQDYGLGQRTLADGLAVQRASPLVLRLVGDQIAAVVAVNDRAMLDWVRRAWLHGRLRLEPSAAAALAALEPVRQKMAAAGRQIPDDAVHVAWLTGGSLLPDEEFYALLQD